ncbi:MAG: isoprenyl transferase [Candidatus Aminicenantia bacterium]
MKKELEGFIEIGSEEERLVAKVDFSRLPNHIAIIMDGNGRWARERNLPRVKGHEEGINSVREIVETCARLGIKILTLYAFSKENWKRPKSEINTLWKLLENYLRKDSNLLIKNKLSLKVIGDIEELPSSVQRELVRVMNMTKNNDRLKLILALNYGGRAEIIDAIKKLFEDVQNGFDIESLNETNFSKYLYTSRFPDPDLVIRTSGEMRVSNFLLWQIAYSEIWITPVLWPDFRKKHLLEAIIDYQKRERRFGGIKPHNNYHS